MFLTAIILILLAWIYWATDNFIAVRLSVRTSMAKTVGDTITVSVSAVPAGAPITNVVVSADPAFFAPTADPMVFTCIAPTTGATVSAKATAANGNVVSGVSDPFDVVAPVVVATGLTVTVA